MSLRVALRYLFSRKSHGAVNVISAISVAGVAVACAAMVVVLSVFNGFSQVASQKLGQFEPDLLVTPVEGKHIDGVDTLSSRLRGVAGVAWAEGAIAEQAFASGSDGRQMPVQLRGISPQTLAHSGLQDITIDGTCQLADSSQALLSVGVALGLNARPGSGTTIDIYEPRRRGRVNPANPATAFRSARVVPTGVYQVEQEEYDRDILIVPLSLARQLLDYTPAEASQIQIFLHPKADITAVRHAVEGLLPRGEFRISDRQQQQGATFRMIAIEKWVTFLMLAFILVIAAFNILASMSMLILEKQPNMGVLRAMGAPRRMLRAIFLNQSWMITLAGGATGIVVGILLSLGQQHFGWLKLGGSDPTVMAMDTYPVALQWADIPAVALALTLVALLTATLTTLLLRKV